MRRRGDKGRKRCIFALFLALLLLLAVLADLKIRPLVKSAACERAKIEVNQIINDTVSDLIKAEEITYNNIITVVFDDSNNVKTIESDVLKLNRFKADVEAAIIQNVKDYDHGNVDIRIGTLLGSDYFAGRGPQLRFQFDLATTVESTFRDQFIDAGINQTKHQLMLQVTTGITVLLPWYNTDCELVSQVLIAETIIVGNVPDSYTQITLDGLTVSGQNE